MRSFQFFLLFLVLWLARAQSPAAVPPATPADPQILHDIPYVENATPRQRLDLYLSGSSATPRPLIVFIHGGAWQSGSKAQCPARRLLPFGYDVASVDYRLSQDAPFPAQIQDCKAAIRWLRAHAAEHDIDASRIGVWGESAGGHLVALLGVTGTDRAFDTGPNLDQSSAVQCVLDCFGPTDFLHYGDPPRTDLDGAGSAVARLFGGTVSTHQEAARAASPIYYVTAAAAPFLILQGDADPLVPLQQSQLIDAALRKAGVESTLRVIPGGGHGGPGFGTLSVSTQVVGFFNRHLQK